VDIGLSFVKVVVTIKRGYWFELRESSCNDKTWVLV
jgi:hypothetical protein